MLVLKNESSHVYTHIFHNSLCFVDNNGVVFVVVVFSHQVPTFFFLVSTLVLPGRIPAVTSSFLLTRDLTGERVVVLAGYVNEQFMNTWLLLGVAERAMG